MLGRSTKGRKYPAGTLNVAIDKGSLVLPSIILKLRSSNEKASNRVETLLRASIERGSGEPFGNPHSVQDSSLEEFILLHT
jgi:hypothetical protein